MQSVSETEARKADVQVVTARKYASGGNKGKRQAIYVKGQQTTRGLINIVISVANWVTKLTPAGIGIKPAGIVTKRHIEQACHAKESQPVAKTHCVNTDMVRQHEESLSRMNIEHTPSVKQRSCSFE